MTPQPEPRAAKVHEWADLADDELRLAQHTLTPADHVVCGFNQESS